MKTKTQEALAAMQLATRKFVGHAKTVPNFQKAIFAAKRALCQVAQVPEQLVFLVWHPPQMWEGGIEPSDLRFEVVTRRSADALKNAGIQLIPFEWEGGKRVPTEQAERWLVGESL